MHTIMYHVFLFTEQIPVFQAFSHISAEMVHSENCLLVKFIFLSVFSRLNYIPHAWVEISSCHWPNGGKFMDGLVNWKNAQAFVVGLNLNRKNYVQFTLLTCRGQCGLLLVCSKCLY